MPADPATAASPWTVTTAAPGAGEPNYDAIYAAVVATAQGRWFLAQYASRNRNADTAQLLAAINRLQTEVERSAPPAAAEPDPRPGPDIARLRHDLGELAEALIRARADIAVIKPGKLTERPSILAATEALLGLAWFMRERGMDSRFCDRIDDCADDIYAVCAIPDLTAQRTRMIVDVLGDLENRLVAITAALDDGDQFADLRASPAANANSPAPAKPVAVKARMAGADIAAFIPGLVAGIEPTAVRADSAAPAGVEMLASPRPPAVEAVRHRDDQPAATNPAGAPSRRLSHLMMAAELDRLLDAQTEADASEQPPLEVVVAAASIEATAPVTMEPPGVAVARVEAPSSDTIEVEPASPEAIEVAPAPIEPEVPTKPAAAPPRRVAVIAKELFADVMALSEEERVALFT
jgi:hypothetical protein